MTDVELAEIEETIKFWRIRAEAAGCVLRPLGVSKGRGEAVSEGLDSGVGWGKV